MTPFSSDGFSTFAALRPNERSQTVLKAIAELFVIAPTHRREDLLQFEELALTLIAVAELPDRRLFAQVLADRTDLPHSVALMLARDTAEVAEPVLRLSPVLTTGDLLDLASGSAEHRRFIAMRKALAAPVAALLGLPLATAAPHDQSPADPATEIESDADAADDDAPHVMQGRRPKPVSGVERLIDMFFALDAHSRRHALVSYDTEVALRMVEVPGRPSGGAQLAGDFGARLFELFVEGDRQASLALMAQGLRLDFDVARRILADEGGEPLAIALAAAGVSHPMAINLFLWSDPRIGHSFDKVRELSDLYGGLGWRVADAIVERWRGAPWSAHVEEVRQVSTRERLLRAVEQTSHAHGQAPAEAAHGVKRA